MALASYLLALYVIIPAVRTANIDDVTARTMYGALRGVRVKESYQLGPGKVTGSVDKFLGIPYARPPVGPRRFKPPEPPYAWQGVKDAISFGSVCPQVIFHPDTAEHFQDEDCLFLDVYAPYQADHEDARYPVMLYIHGGSFEVGSGKLYDGTVLAQLGVVVVTINYRLGALGFMTSGDDILTGNYGLMDQVQAIKWVRQNIASFRGDPEKVTLFGHSAGGSSVGLHLIIPQAQGLIQGVIAQSGSAVASYSVHDSSVDFHLYVRRVGMLFDCHQDAIPDVVECLRAVDSKRMIDNRRMFPLYDPIDPEFRPFLDGTWIVDYPRNMFAKGQFQRLPIILGTVRDEFANYFSGGARHRLSFDPALDNYVAKSVQRRADMVQLIQFEYTHWQTTGRTPLDRGALLSDMHMVAPTVDMAELISRYNGDIYQYHFSTPESYHSVELNYVFGAPFSGRYADEMTIYGSKNFSSEDRQLCILVMTTWTNFAKLGIPDTDASNITWNQFNDEDKAYLEINTQRTHTLQKLRQDKVVFWNRIIPKLKDYVNETAELFELNDMYVEPGQEDGAAYGVYMWSVLTVATVLAVLVLILTVMLVRLSLKHERYRKALSGSGVGENGRADVIRPAKV